jgi:uncharacterized protein with gpF-like domain
MVLPQSERFAEAIASMRRRVPVSRRDWDVMEASERRHAFTVAHVTEMQVLQQTLDALTSAVDEGTTLQDFKDDMQVRLIESWGGEIPGRIETIFRTNVLGSYAQGRHSVLSAPVVKAARPYWRYDDVPTDRECELCEECGGTVLPADDPWWSDHTPLLHHCCECRITPLSPEEAAEEGIDDEGPDVEADEGFGEEPEDVGKDWEPDLSAFDPELADALRTRIGKLD